MQVITPKRSTPFLRGTLQNVFFPPEKDQYRYFAYAAEYPFTQAVLEGDFPVVKATWAAEAAMLSYARFGSQRMTDAEFLEMLALGGLTLEKKIGVDPGDWNAPGTQAFFASTDDFAILAFRGTEVDDPADEHADLDILLVHEPDYRGAPSSFLGHLALITHLFSVPCLVHQGFQTALDSVWDQVHEVISAYRLRRPDSEICITGHSLGGALALLTYSRCSDANTSVYTIGCPRVGNTAFRDRVAGSPGQGHFRCVNFNDLVTHVPLESALYVHAPAASFRIDEAGNIVSQDQDVLTSDLGVLAKVLCGLPADLRSNLRVLDQLPAPPGVVDHSPARYCMRLRDCVG